MTMESYVVRIYRRESGEPLKISGYVFDTASGSQKTFNDLQELCEVFSGLSIKMKGKRRKQEQHDK